MWLPGNVKGDLSLQGKMFNASIKVSDSLPCPAILGDDFIRHFSGLDFGGEAPKSKVMMAQNQSSRYADLLDKYSDVFDKPIGKAKLGNYNPHPIIQLEDGTRAYQDKIRTLSPKHQSVLDEQIPELLRQGIIEESFSEWRHSPVVVPKRSGGFRVAINYKPVNGSTKSYAYPFPRMEDVLTKLSKAKYFSLLDFSQMYHQIELHQDDKPKTAFWACGKLWQYIRQPYGLKNAVANSNRAMDETFGDIQNKVIWIDDLLPFGETVEEHDQALEKVLQRARERGISFNKAKCTFGVASISYLGHIIENGTVRPDPDRIAPLMNMPLPQTVKQLQRFLGMLSYLRNNVPNFAAIAKPLYDMKQFGKIEWNTENRKAVDLLKDEISKSVLAIPKPDEKLILETDASKETIAAYLRNQKGQPVTFASRNLRGSELNYDIVEKEALAIYWAITVKFRTYLLGREFEVHSDHQPLQWLFSTVKPTRKLLQWRMDLLEYNFKVVYKPGKTNQVADCLSRAFLLLYQLGEDDECQLDDEERLNDNLKAIPLWMVKNYQKRDPHLKVLVNTFKSQFQPSIIPNSLWALRKDLVFEDGVLFHKEDSYKRCLIPKPLRERTLAAAHQGHPGRDSMMATMRQKVFWPKMRNDVAEYCAKCRICAFTKPRFVKPTGCPLIVTSPMELVAVDFVGMLPTSKSGKKYLLTMVDCFSRYAEVFALREITTEALLDCLRQWISRYGLPDSIISDRGSQFESFEFRQYCWHFGIKKRRTTAYHPQGNGICERFNGIIWSKLQARAYALGLEIGNWDTLLPTCLFEYRQSTNATTGYSPFELIYQYSVKTQLPSTRNVNQKYRKARKNIWRNRNRNLQYYNRAARDRYFAPGSEAVVKNEHPNKRNKYGYQVTVLEQVNPHIVKVRFSNGREDTVSVARLSPIPPRFDDLADHSSQEGAAVVPNVQHAEVQPVQDDILEVAPAVADAPPSPALRERLRPRVPKDYGYKSKIPILRPDVKVQNRLRQADGSWGPNPVPEGGEV